MIISATQRSTAKDTIWDIKTDMDPETLTLVGKAIMARWIAFAMGSAALGGRVLMHPTGRYASSIRFMKTGEASIAIMAVVSKDNPEANILETGHAEHDLKEDFAQGTALPMFRGSGDTYWGGRGYAAPILNRGPLARKNNVWAAVRQQGTTGFARVGATGWIIPAMKAYSPAGHLVELLRAGTFDV